MSAQNTSPPPVPKSSSQHVGLQRPPPLPSTTTPPPIPIPLSANSLPPPLPTIPRPIPAAPPELPKSTVVSGPNKGVPPAITSSTNSATEQTTQGTQNGLRNTLIGGVVVVMLVAVGTGAYLWQARANEKTLAEKLAAEKQQLQEQMRSAEEAAKAREAALRIQAEKEQERVQAELEAAKAAANAIEAPPVEAPTSGFELAAMHLRDSVPTSEASRRSAVLAKAEKDNAGVESRLSKMQAQQVFTAAGIDPVNAIAAASKIQQSVLFPTATNILEPTLQAIEAMPKPARGDRKAARSANDEGLRLMQAGQYSDAATAFNRAVSADPADIEVITNLSYSYLKNGQLAEAIRIANYAVRIAPRRAGAWNQLAVAYAQSGADWLAVRAFLVLYTLSGDQAKTRDFLNRTETENTDERVREAAKLALLVLPEAVAK